MRPVRQPSHLVSAGTCSTSPPGTLAQGSFRYLRVVGGEVVTPSWPHAASLAPCTAAGAQPAPRRRCPPAAPLDEGAGVKEDDVQQALALGQAVAAVGQVPAPVVGVLPVRVLRASGGGRGAERAGWQPGRALLQRCCASPARWGCSSSWSRGTARGAPPCTRRTAGRGPPCLRREGRGRGGPVRQPGCGNCCGAWRGGQAKAQPWRSHGAAGAAAQVRAAPRGKKTCIIMIAKHSIPGHLRGRWEGA
jgi:hypothetical protein